MELFMKISVVILVILAITMFVIICIHIYAFSDKTNHRYCKVFEREKMKLWQHMHANVFNFKYAYTYKGNRHFVWNNYEAIVWADDGLTSVHNNDIKECILCNFDKKYSGKMSVLLLNCVGVPDNEKDLYDSNID